jgi:uncharacterized protein YerC
MKNTDIKIYTDILNKRTACNGNKALVLWNLVTELKNEDEDHIELTMEQLIDLTGVCKKTIYNYLASEFFYSRLELEQLGVVSPDFGKLRKDSSLVLSYNDNGELLYHIYPKSLDTIADLLKIRLYDAKKYINGVADDLHKENLSGLIIVNGTVTRINQKHSYISQHQRKIPILNPTEFLYDAVSIDEIDGINTLTDTMLLVDNDKINVNAIVSYKEIAEQMGVSTSTVGRRIRKLREQGKIMVRDVYVTNKYLVEKVGDYFSFNKAKSLIQKGFGFCCKMNNIVYRKAGFIVQLVNDTYINGKLVTY